MVKGIQKQMIMVRTEESSLFEAAYFILRDSVEERTGSDIVAEATKLVTAADRGTVKKKRSRVSLYHPRLLFLALGALLGITLALLALFLIRML